jgi:hypothetical protein
MNFSLSICGLGHLTFLFRDIWPCLPIDDFLAYVVHRVRGDLQGDELNQFREMLGKTVLLFSDDGSVRRLLAGPPPRNAPPNGSEPFTTCGAAFDILDDGTKEGHRGWLYFAYRHQKIQCTLKVADHLGGYTKSAGSNAKHCQWTFSAVDLVCGEILDVKKAMLQKRVVASVDDVAILCPPNLATLFDDSPTVDENALELLDDDFLFFLLRDCDSCELRCVERDGIRVSVLTAPTKKGGKRLLLPRFPRGATIADVVRRLWVSFQMRCEYGLFLDGAEFEGTLQTGEKLIHLQSTPHGEVQLLLGHSAHAEALRQQVEPNMKPPTLLTAATARIPTSRSVSEESSNVGGYGHLVCRVDVAQLCEAHRRHGTKPPLPIKQTMIDISLPDDGLPYTARDLKTFLATRGIAPSAISSGDLFLMLGRRAIDDHEDLRVTLLTSQAPQESHAAAVQRTILLTCCVSR